MELEETLTKLFNNFNNLNEKKNISTKVCQAFNDRMRSF